MSKTNIIIFAYNRPKNLKKNIKNLLNLKGRKFYFVLDGHKSSDDRNKTEKVHQIVNKSKFKKKKILKFQNNIGVRNIFQKGLDWVFKFERKIIIIEDDVIIKKDFFDWADLLLEKHKNNKKISQISANNVNDKITKNKKNDFFISKYSNIWGWATWKDRWESYDNTFSKLNKILRSEKIFISKNEEKYWKKYFILHKKNKKYGSWDFAWTYTNFLKKRYSIVPKKNLSINTGLTSGTGQNPYKLAKLKLSNLKKNNKKINLNIIHEYDLYSSTNIYSIPSLKFRIKSKFKKLFFNK